MTLTDFELPNVGAGPETFRLQDVLADEDTNSLVLLLQRDYHCPKCRQQVQDVAERYAEFENANALVASVLPESRVRTQNWQDAYSLPYPLLADPSTELGDELDQPTRFGALGNVHDMIGRMPEAIVIDVSSTDPEIVFTHRGTSPSDRPSIDELLDEVQKIA